MGALDDLLHEAEAIEVGDGFPGLMFNRVLNEEERRIIGDYLVSIYIVEERGEV